MRKIQYIFGAALIALMAFYACNPVKDDIPEENPPQEESVFELSVSEVTVSSTRNDFRVTVKTTLDYHISSISDWISEVSKVSGGDSFTHTFQVEANSGEEERTGTVVFCNEKSVCVPVTVIQEGITPSLEATPESVSFGEGAESKTAYVTSNLSWTASSSESWCTVSPAEGSGNGTITISTEKNMQVAFRSAVVTVSSADGRFSRTISVNQDGNESSTVNWNQAFPHKSLLMKFTATWCPYCPIMAETAHLYQSRYPGTLEVVNIHGSGSDYYNKAFSPLIGLYNKDGYYPQGMIDERRLLDNYDSESGVKIIKQFVDEQTSRYPAVSAIDLSSSFQDGKLDIDLKLYLKKADSYKVSVVVTESGVVGYQAGAGSSANSYVHDDIARIAVSDVSGEAFTTSEDKSLVKRHYSVNIPDSYVKDNLHVLVYVQRVFGSQTVIRSDNYGNYYVDNCISGKAGEQVKPW